MTKKYPSVLICSPQHESKRYCWDDWKENVTSFTYPNFDVLLVDNSPDNSFRKEIADEKAYVIHIKPKSKSLIHILAESHEQCRQFAIARGYDYMLHLETDVFPPP